MVSIHEFMVVGAIEGKVLTRNCIIVFRRLVKAKKHVVATTSHLRQQLVVAR